MDPILDFVRQHSHFHIVDMPYRLCSPAAQDPANVRLWQNSQGGLIGFAVIQLPFVTLDWATTQPELQEGIIGWAVNRLESITAERGEPVYFVLDSRSDSDPLPPKFGFELDEWTIRRMCLSPEHPLHRPDLPPGFTIRPLNGQSEAGVYAALHREAFGTKNMTEEWRARTIAHPAYCPDLDLVVEDETGRLVAFCIGWMAEINGEKWGQIEPLGVLPDCQQKGLGRAILLENLRRMRDQGATRIFIDAESYNPGSQHLYESVGFRDSYQTYKYFREFQP